MKTQEQNSLFFVARRTFAPLDGILVKEVGLRYRATG